MSLLGGCLTWSIQTSTVFSMLNLSPKPQIWDCISLVKFTHVHHLSDALDSWPAQLIIHYPGHPWLLSNKPLPTSSGSIYTANIPQQPQDLLVVGNDPKLASQALLGSSRGPVSLRPVVDGHSVLRAFCRAGTGVKTKIALTL